MYEYPEKIDEEEVHVKYTAIEHASKQRKWIPWVVLFFGVLFLIIASILTALHFSMERNNQQMLEERDSLKQKLQDIKQHMAEGWVFFNGSCYLGSATEQSWNKSRELCLEKGADLIIINSTEEQEFARLAFPGRRWIGLSEPQEEGVWKWVDGSPLTTSFWLPGQPSNYAGDEDCVEINYRTDGFRNWNDENCAHAHECICEKTII